jgi:hypothetical protein
LIRSELPLPTDPDSDSLPIPGSLPKPPKEGILGGSAGRATGRPAALNGVAGFAALGWAGRGAGRAAAFFLLPADAAGRPLGLALRFAVGRFAVDFLVAERFTVERLAVVRLAVDFLPPDRFAVERFEVERLAVDFLAFFFAAISPPFGCAMDARAWCMRMRTRGCYLRFIASAPSKDKHFPRPAGPSMRV